MKPLSSSAKQPLSQLGPCHNENATDLVLLSLISFYVSPANGFEMIASFKGYNLCVGPKCDVMTPDSATYFQLKSQT
jgi:hypothetical protein